VTQEITTQHATVTVYTDTFNKRIRIDDYSGELNEVLLIINRQLADWVEKLIVKSRTSDLPFFMAHGFSAEGFIKGYFSGADMHFVSMYFSAGRERSEKWYEEQSLIQKLVADKRVSEPPSTEGIRVASFSQANDLARLYKTIFKIYPTPLHDEGYIIRTLQEGTVYAYMENDHRIVSAAAAEINWKYKNVELTDCATLPEAEGQGHMKKLLFFLEQKLRTEGITCCYSLARAASFSMNKVFAHLDYTYGGRLINNCFIFTGLEDMNVWYKR
jgi:putative beta-lysine N-acetyltransferase